MCISLQIFFVLFFSCSHSHWKRGIQDLQIWTRSFVGLLKLQTLSEQTLANSREDPRKMPVRCVSKIKAI